MMRNVYLGIFTAAATIFGSVKALANVPNSGEAKPVKENTGKPYQQDVLPVEEVLQSIPSPLEISVLIKEVGTVYNKADLNDPNSVSRYNTAFQKALNLGIYGTDLGYANIYGKNQDAISYLNSVKKLADGLGIGAFFEYNEIKQLAESSGKLDELIRKTTYNFEKINEHLRERKREDISILCLTGGWIEAVYLTTLVNQRVENDVLKEKIGDQKIVLEQLLLVLDIYKSKPGFGDLIRDLTYLQEIYDQIEVERIYGKPSMKEVDGVLVVVSGEKTIVKVTEADVQKITVLLKSIRDKIVK
ncbi:hypothetical protein V6R21_10690 [Limibacter armeniacum]|uniref:hypothetical protein n=1 Tax=Limibacter armeniacum TaxID=466084 RepID=UPI002FE65029